MLGSQFLQHRQDTVELWAGMTVHEAESKAAFLAADGRVSDDAGEDSLVSQVPMQVGKSGFVSDDDRDDPAREKGERRPLPL